MKIEDILRAKGSDVVTITATASVSDLIELLGTRNIGAAVVSPDGHSVAGIISERDVVRRMAIQGEAVTSLTVGELMTAPALTCAPDDVIEDTAHTMTNHRIRHLPVVTNGRLVGLVSIGDVVKFRIDQLTDERNHLLDYLHN